MIGKIITRGDFTGRLNEVAVIYPREDLPTKRLVLVGLGKRVDFSLERLRGAFSKAAQHIRTLNVSELSTSIDWRGVNLPLDQATEAVVEGIILGLYRFARFKTIARDETGELSTVTIMENKKVPLRSSGPRRKPQRSSPMQSCSHGTSSPRRPTR